MKRGTGMNLLSFATILRPTGYSTYEEAGEGFLPDRLNILIISCVPHINSHHVLSLGFPSKSTPAFIHNAKMLDNHNQYLVVHLKKWLLTAAKGNISIAITRIL